MIIRKK